MLWRANTKNAPNPEEIVNEIERQKKKSFNSNLSIEGIKKDIIYLDLAWEIYDSDSFNFVHSCSILFPNFLYSNAPITVPIVLFNTSSASQ